MSHHLLKSPVIAIPIHSAIDANVYNAPVLAISAPKPS